MLGFFSWCCKSVCCGGMTNTVIHMFLVFVVGTLEAYFILGSGGDCVNRWTKSHVLLPCLRCTAVKQLCAQQRTSAELTASCLLVIQDCVSAMEGAICMQKTLFSDMPFILVCFPLQLKGLLVHVCVLKESPTCSSFPFLLLGNDMDQAQYFGIKYRLLIYTLHTLSVFSDLGFCLCSDYFRVFMIVMGFFYSFRTKKQIWWKFSNLVIVTMATWNMVFCVCTISWLEMLALAEVLCFHFPFSFSSTIPMPNTSGWYFIVPLRNWSTVHCLYLQLFESSGMWSMSHTSHCSDYMKYHLKCHVCVTQIVKLSTLMVPLNLKSMDCILICTPTF